MDQKTVGQNLKRLRLEAGLTQSQMAEKLGVTDRAVSKWERGLGCPDLSFWPQIADVFHVDVSRVIFGVVSENQTSSGNMKNTKFYLCPVCGSFTTSAEEIDVYCCARKLEALVPEKAKEEEKLQIEVEERTEVFVSSEHEMTKDHYISFVSYVTSDTILTKRAYPEWNLNMRLPYLGHGKILWFDTQAGLYYTLI
ncbi:MAG: helix-turn-helix domain-containing protein [Spirochaetales bacterium]|nr:helix-turn-helix domain-containing protein [Candidatus Physcosoma equi]